jgi:formylglycine-generating enzyme required for sulfatase activity
MNNRILMTVIFSILMGKSAYAGLLDVPAEVLVAEVISGLDIQSTVCVAKTCQWMDVLLTVEKTKKQIDYYRGKVIPVEGGKFEMGSPPAETSRYPVQEDLHEKETLPIHLGETQVTQEMYLRVMGAETGRNPSKFKNEADCPDRFREMTVEIGVHRGMKIPYCEGHPVESLTKIQMEAYLIKLEEIIQPLWKIAYPKDKRIPTYVLPSEEQWEKATQEKLDQPDERGMTSRHVVFSGTDDETKLGEFVVYDTNRTAPVKSKTPNSRGFYDMSGNVWEMTSSKWARDPTLSEENRTSPYFVERGGSWRNNDPRNLLRTSMRRWIPENNAYDALGFRLGEVFK